MGDTELRRWSEAEIEAGCGPAGALKHSEPEELIELQGESQRRRVECEIVKSDGLLRQVERVRFALSQRRRPSIRWHCCPRVCRSRVPGFKRRSNGRRHSAPSRTKAWDSRSRDFRGELRPLWQSAGSTPSCGCVAWRRAPSRSAADAERGLACAAARALSLYHRLQPRWHPTPAGSPTGVSERNLTPSGSVL